MSPLCCSVVGVAILGSSALAAAASAQSEPSFAPPVRLKAGAKFMGEDRLYPSPVFHDVNGDGLLDVVIGDLPGVLTVALRKPGADPIAFEGETTVTAAGGQPLKFHNW